MIFILDDIGNIVSSFIISQYSLSETEAKYFLRRRYRNPPVTRKYIYDWKTIPIGLADLKNAIELAIDEKLIYTTSNNNIER